MTRKQSEVVAGVVFDALKSTSVKKTKKYIRRLVKSGMTKPHAKEVLAGVYEMVNLRINVLTQCEWDNLHKEKPLPCAPLSYK